MEIPVCNTCNSSKPNSYVLVCTECASKINESQTTDTQQLKAEIRLLLTEIEYDERGVGQITKGAIARKLRELSAV